MFSHREPRMLRLLFFSFQGRGTIHEPVTISVFFSKKIISFPVHFQISWCNLLHSVLISASEPTKRDFARLENYLPPEKGKSSLLRVQVFTSVASISVECPVFLVTLPALLKSWPKADAAGPAPLQEQECFCTSGYIPVQRSVVVLVRNPSIA